MSHVRDVSSGARKYSQQEKDRFFAVLDRVGSVSVAAAELGFNRNTCFAWARAAGISSRRDFSGQAHSGRAEFTRLRAQGLSRREAAVRVGVHPRTAQDWDRGIRKVGDSRYYPDGRVVDYTSGMTSTVAAPVATVEKVLDARFLSVTEREQIADLHRCGAVIREIARQLGRVASTISRELARNTDPVQGYRPHAAHRAAAARRGRPKTAKLALETRLRAYVAERLGLRWSPEQICRTLVIEYPDDQEMRVCPETIYQALYLQARGGLKREVAAALRTGRARRVPHHDRQQRRARFVDEMLMISERPPEVADRAVPGHWEGDLILGADNASAIGTLVERTTRYVLLVHLPTDHTAETVRNGLVTTMAVLPGHLRGSLTWDQGAEMAAHRSFSLATGMPVYFCDPASPWQRGSNENTNGLLEWAPKAGL